MEKCLNGTRSSRAELSWNYVAPCVQVVVLFWGSFFAEDECVSNKTIDTFPTHCGEYMYIDEWMDEQSAGQSLSSLQRPTSIRLYHSRSASLNG